MHAIQTKYIGTYIHFKIAVFTVQFWETNNCSFLQKNSGFLVSIDFIQCLHQVLDELDEILHRLDDLGDGQVVKDLLAVAAQLPDLKCGCSQPKPRQQQQRKKQRCLGIDLKDF
jgi:hypothetical protein